jgi:hypothetical protein
MMIDILFNVSLIIWMLAVYFKLIDIDYKLGNIQATSWRKRK